jgi:molybdopterin-containing oxidoreductase family membrane subunit
MVLASFGWFTLLFMVFCKVFPSVSMYEVKEMVYHRTLAKKGLEHTGMQESGKGAH